MALSYLNAPYMKFQSKLPRAIAIIHLYAETTSVLTRAVYEYKKSSPSLVLRSPTGYCYQNEGDVYY